MKYKDTKPSVNYEDDYYWYIVDESAHEFATCDNCGIEVPLSNFINKWLCKICANTTIKQVEPAVQSANMILLTLGAFDDIEVLLAREHIPDYYE